MNEKWIDHHQLEGKHSFLSPSQNSWLNYDDEKLVARYYSQFAQLIGTTMHELASKLIKRKIKINNEQTSLILMALDDVGVPRGAYDPEFLLTNLVAFVNDAIGFHMDSEVILYCDIDCFGTTDAILADIHSKTLRIHDLKNGTHEADMEQLLVYAADYCIEYKRKPTDFKTIELRLYQNCQVVIYNPHHEEIQVIMDKIKHNIDILKEIRKGNIK